MAELTQEHRRCGCPEQYGGRDCPACRGTGLIPPITRDEWEEQGREIERLKARIKQLEIGHDDWRTLARRAKERADQAEAKLAEAQAEIEELELIRDHCHVKIVEQNERARQAEAREAKLREALAEADGMLDANPAGVDEGADPNNPSPEDASAHTCGLIRQVLHAALAASEPADPVGMGWIRSHGHWFPPRRAALAASPEPARHPFEPCREGDEGDTPEHNFLRALLCAVCGLPREKHSEPIPPEEKE